MLGEPSTAILPDRIYSSWPLAHSSRLHKKHGGKLMPTTGARTCSVDQYVMQAGIRRIDLMKIDVDGYESAVLCGAQSTLMSMRPPIIMEFAPYVLEEAGASIEGLCEILRRHKYHLYAASTGHMLPVAVDELKTLLPDGCGINVLGVPSEKVCASDVASTEICRRRCCQSMEEYNLDCSPSTAWGKIRSAVDKAWQERSL